MDPTDDTFTRRRVLTGIGSFGALGFVGAAARPALGFDPVDMNRTTRVSEAEVNLVVDWRATHNGDVVSSTGFETTEDRPDAPAIDISSVLPGDEGSLTIRVSVPSADEVEEPRPLDVGFRIDSFEAAENGLNEPEADSGDDSPSRGELQDAIDATVWYDVGSAGVDYVGACNGTREPGEPVVADGSLADVARSLSEPRRLDPHDGTGRECLTPGSSVCLSLSWRLDETVTNVVQSDSVSFAVDFRATPCDGDGTESATTDDSKGPNDDT